MVVSESESRSVPSYRCVLVGLRSHLLTWQGNIRTSTIPASRRGSRPPLRAIVALRIAHVFLFFVFRLTFSFQLLDKLRSQVSSLLPPGTCLQFLSCAGFSIPTARRFSSIVANSRFRAFRESICAQEKVPSNFYEYALGGTRTHEIDL